MISSHLKGAKKFKVQLNSSRNFQSVSESLSMKLNCRFQGVTMFVFNFSIGSLEQIVKLSWLLIFDFLGNSLL